MMLLPQSFPRITDLITIVALANLLVVVQPAFAGERPLPQPAQGDLGLVVDVHSFGGDGAPYEEVSLRIQSRDLVFESENDSLRVARYRPHLMLYDSEGDLVRNIEGERRVVFPADANIPEQIDEIARFRLDPGDYIAKLEIEAVGNGRSAGSEFNVSVPEFSTGKLTTSDLFFVREVNPHNPGPEPDLLKKNEQVLLPLPSRIVPAGESLRWYVELYEIGQLAHTVRFLVLDRFGNAVFTHERAFPTYRDRARFIEGAALRYLPPDLYTLRVEVKAGSHSASTERDFRIDGPAGEVSEAFTEPMQALGQRILQEFSTSDAASRYAGLDAPDRARFLYGHWLERQPLFAQAYVALLTGFYSHEVSLPTIRELGHVKNLRKRVDKTFAERIPEGDTLGVVASREILDFVLDENEDDPFALTADALLALEVGLLSEGEIYAQKAFKINSEFADAYNARGIAQIGRKDWSEAAERFQTAARLRPGWVAPLINQELALFIRGKGNDEEELGRIRTALQHDSLHPALHYIAGRLYERHNRLEESVAAHKRQVEVNPLHAWALFDLGRVLFKQGRIDTATVVWRNLMEARPDFREVCTHPLLDAYLNTGETGKAQALVAEEILTLDEEARMRVEDISLLAGPDEVTTYNALDEEDRPAFVRAFWQKRDPTPATPGNERLVEHYRRVVYALRHYSNDGVKWDRRGDVYIRYGEPAHVGKSGDKRFETDKHVVRVKDRLQNTLSPEARQEIIERAGRYRTSTRDTEIIGEYGQKVDGSDFESIDFEMNPNRAYFISDQDEDPQYVRGTEEATYRSRSRDFLIRGIPLFPIDSTTPWEYWIYPDVAGGIEVVFTSMANEQFYDYPDLTIGRKISDFNQLTWNERRPEIVVARAASAQPDRYRPPGKTLEFHFTTADFRGTPDRSRLEVYLGVPLQEVMAGGGETFERGVALFDSTWTPIYRRVVPLGFEVADLDVEAGTLAIDELALQVPPGKYYLGLQINHPQTHRQSGYTQELVVEAYDQPELSMSDIELAGHVEQDSTVVTKGGLRVVSLPSRTFKLGQPVIVYYEVYALQPDEFGQTNYRVDYRISAKEGKLSGIRVLRALGRLLGIVEKSVVTISYERSGTEPDEHNYLEIDPGESKEGRYELTVTVTDLNSEQTSAKDVIFLIGE
ncbi:MAG: hypothetical protein CME26_13390 [Gemmatimonadetes bacterium]|nr:hypothetical protein [Gemmatimonadota bacterium]